MTILDPFGGPWAPFGDHFAIRWVTDAFRETLEGPIWSFSDFLWIWGFALEPTLEHFSIFSVIVKDKMQVWNAGVIFDDI